MEGIVLFKGLRGRENMKIINFGGAKPKLRWRTQKRNLQCRPSSKGNLSEKHPLRTPSSCKAPSKQPPPKPLWPWAGLGLGLGLEWLSPVFEKLAELLQLNQVTGARALVANLGILKKL
ncbi:hypothetical protein AMTR_s00069p00128690 [Amborella trichopoda]|uniref:Uncharacterized protein n=1 Tax=Amborella trichopoda TaxID=13333 RepID=U5D156_AMBTC|nr:hypothetical protein AMTR_s00069p00128690 [Amborella trichopoda]